jgi:hypothetical protein
LLVEQAGQATDDVASAGAIGTLAVTSAPLTVTGAGVDFLAMTVLLLGGAELPPS